jgi:hypothetical protein
MSEIQDGSDQNCATDQAAELAVLVELEACWENLRTTASRPPQVQLNIRDLQGKQKAYEIFRGKLAGYNKRYAPAHIPELLLNTPARLGLWCRSMRDLYLRIEHDARGHCPVHLLEKAYRRADQLAGKTSKNGVHRPGPANTIRAAIDELEALSRWCDEQAESYRQGYPDCDNLLTAHEQSA